MCRIGDLEANQARPLDNSHAVSMGDLLPSPMAADLRTGQCVRPCLTALQPKSFRTNKLGADHPPCHNDRTRIWKIGASVCAHGRVFVVAAYIQTYSTNLF